MRLRDLQRGLAKYQAEMRMRSQAEQERDREFDNLAARYSSRVKPHFLRRELVVVMTWKHTDGRWRKNALEGLAALSDSDIRSLTNQLASIDDPRSALQAMATFPRGIGPASISAILTAARPEDYGVIDTYALLALRKYEPEPWHRQIKFNNDGMPIASGDLYPDFIHTCRRLSARARKSSGSPEWTVRQVEKALWGLGKLLAGKQHH